MSTRILRRLRAEEKTEIKISCESKENEENTTLTTSCGGARQRNLPINMFDVLMETTHSDSEELGDMEETKDRCDKRKKKKKKRKKARKENILSETNISQTEFDVENTENNLNENTTKEQTQRNDSILEVPKDVCEYDRGELNIRLGDLNANNELKKIFGSNVVNDKNRRRNRNCVKLKNAWLVTCKENWPILRKTGLSMRCEKINGVCYFLYVHDTDYQNIQRKFLREVNSFNQENIANLVYLFPYHVDALVQLSDIYKSTEDLSTAADLIERALYSLESSFHPLFNMAHGICKLDYRRQENRALFICLFKHLTFVGQKACYHTALELCKLLLSLDFDLDPLAIVLCVDFYALRSRKYTWLIEVGKKWEKKKNVSQLPNFAFSVALAHFLLAESSEKQDFSQANKLLQNALISFPGMLNLLLEKCAVHLNENVVEHNFFKSNTHLTQSRPLFQLLILYVHRTFCEWKRPNVIQWLESNVHEVIRRVDTGDDLVKESLLRRLRNYSSMPRNILRHIILSDIKEVTATIAANLPTLILSFDPLPPLDSVDIYSYADFFKNGEEPRSLTSLLFATLFTNFHVARERNDLDVNEETVESTENLIVNAPDNNMQQ